MIKVCSKCGKERPARGFYFHEKYCRGTLLVPQKEKYPKQKAIMSSDEYAKFLRKAEATI